MSEQMTDIPVSFCDHRLNNGRIILLCLAGPALCTFVQYLITSFCSRPEVASDVISGTFVRLFVLDKCVKFRDRNSKRSREIPPGAIGGGI